MLLVACCFPPLLHRRARQRNNNNSNLSRLHTLAGHGRCHFHDVLRQCHVVLSFFFQRAQVCVDVRSEQRGRTRVHCGMPPEACRHYSIPTGGFTVLRWAVTVMKLVDVLRAGRCAIFVCTSKFMVLRVCRCRDSVGCGRHRFCWHFSRVPNWSHGALVYCTVFLVPMCDVCECRGVTVDSGVCIAFHGCKHIV